MWLKQLISYLLMPFPLGLLLVVLGLLLLWLTARQRTGRALATGGAAMLLLCSWYPTSQWLLSPLHRRASLMQPASAAGARWVVVLGGGYDARGSAPATSRLSTFTLERLIEGIRVYRNLPGAKLIMSGRGYGELPTEAAVMQEAAVELGVPVADIRQEGESDDTADEARLIRPMVGGDRIVLVTSGVHMDRAVRLFEKQGLTVIPAPAGFWPPRAELWPNSDRVGWVQQAEHEWLGMLWARLRGQI